MVLPCFLRAAVKMRSVHAPRSEGTLGRMSSHDVRRSYLSFLLQHHSNELRFLIWGLFCPATEFWSSPERLRFRGNPCALSTCFISYGSTLELLQVYTEDCRWNNERKPKTDRSRIRMANHLGKKVGIFLFNSCQWTV